MFKVQEKTIIIYRKQLLMCSSAYSTLSNNTSIHSSVSEARSGSLLYQRQTKVYKTITMTMTIPKVLLFTGVVLVCYIAIAYCQEHGHTHRELYVKSTPTQECPQHHQCHTLLSYLKNGTTSFTSNTTLHFLPGNHSAAVPQPMTLVISNISNLALVGPVVGPEEPPVAHIWCSYTMQFHFKNASNVSLKGLEIRECGAYNPLILRSIRFPCNIKFEALSAVPSAILFESVKSIAVENVHILYSFGFGLVVWNSFGNVSVYNSVLLYNGWKNFSSDIDYSIGGNALFYYNMDRLPTEQTELQVISSTFGYGHGNGKDCFSKNVFMPSFSDNVWWD